MALEIERKFLLKDDSWRNADPEGTLYRQGYLSIARERTVRVRLAGEKGFLCVKGETTGFSRQEYEYEIPAADAQTMLDTLALRPLVEKRRYRIPFQGLVWEVDEFFAENAGLVVAEVELPGEDFPISLPPWAGTEVTGEPRYFNSSLSTAPFSTWDK